MFVSSPPPHLPEPYPDRRTYEDEYRHLCRVDECFHGPDDWREVRLPPGLSAQKVYERLPVAAGFELAGYLTRTRIRFVPGWETGAHTIAAKACCWHSHPQDHPNADLPSDRDVYSFLRYRNLRHITVGRERLWVFDKTPATLQTVAKLNRFECRRLVEAVAEVGLDEYPSFALREIGFRKPRSLARFRADWPRLLEGALAIKVTVLERHSASR